MKEQNRFRGKMGDYPQYFPITTNFTGRESEKKQLTDWYNNPEEPFLILEGPPGSGKTSLVMDWCIEKIHNLEIKQEQVFCWSAYHKPFDDFILTLTDFIAFSAGGEPLEKGDLVSLASVICKRKLLLILDGLEWESIGYSSMASVHSHLFLEKEIHLKQENLSFSNPYLLRFLKSLTGGMTKILATSRLSPTDFETLPGVCRMELPGLFLYDALLLLEKEGLKEIGPGAEQMVQTCLCNPLLIKLAAAILKKKKYQIDRFIFIYKKKTRGEKRQIAFLNRVFQALSPGEQEVAAHSSVFRKPVPFSALLSLFPGKNGLQLQKIIDSIEKMGIIFRAPISGLYDFHPALRSYLYRRIKEKSPVHLPAFHYFQSIPPSDNIVSLESLETEIELYYHAIRSGDANDAFELFKNKIGSVLCFRFSAYHYHLRLARELFPYGEEHMPHLEDSSEESWILNEMGNSYALTGQPSKAIRFYYKGITADDEDSDHVQLVMNLGSASQQLLVTGRIAASVIHSQKSLEIYNEVGGQFGKGLIHMEYGRQLIYQGKTRLMKTFQLRDVGLAIAESELETAYDIFEKGANIKSQLLVTVYRALSCLVQSRLVFAMEGMNSYGRGLVWQSMDHANQALELAIKTAASGYPHARDFIRVYTILGESMSLCAQHSVQVPLEELAIPFYDRHFRKKVEDTHIKKAAEWDAAVRCIEEALHRCRKENMADLEPEVLVTYARIEWNRNPGQAFKKIEDIIGDAFLMAQKSGYRTVLADIHLLCAQVLLSGRFPSPLLLGLPVSQHLDQVDENAVDRSKLPDIYSPQNPGFYDNIPGYSILKKSYKHKTRRMEGYWLASKTAEILRGAIQT